MRSRCRSKKGYVILLAVSFVALAPSTLGRYISFAPPLGIIINMMEMHRARRRKPKCLNDQTCKSRNKIIDFILYMSIQILNQYAESVMSSNFDGKCTSFSS